MFRLACVDLPAFPLQILAKRHPDWKNFPMAVVAEERPQAFILWVNENAQRLGIRPGHRYASALALSRDLRAGAVNETEIRKGIEGVTSLLWRFTPEIEHAEGKWNAPGLFWLNATGLERLFSSLDAWASAIDKELKSERFAASIVVGFTRFGSYAVARVVRGVTVLRDREEEEIKARGVPLSRLDIPPDVQVALLKLGIRTVANLLRLPAKGLSKRFGTEIFDLHRLATGDLFAPLKPEIAKEPLLRSMELPSPETASERLVFFVKQLVDDLLKEIYQKSQALTRLHLILELDDRTKRKESLRPDEPTLNSPLLLRLVRLRLETLHLDSSAIFLTIEAEAVRRAQEQLSLVVEKPKREHRIRSLAFARLRATLGEAAVVRAELLDGHLPSARFQWTPLETLPEGDASFKDGARSLVRRIYEKPMALPHCSRHEPDEWMLRGLEFGPASDFLGPYILSGGWWRRTVQREYYFVKMQRGDVFWIFYDRFRRRWFLEGSVE